MPLGTEVGLGQGHIVLDGDPVASQKGGHSKPQFAADVYCGQMAANLSNCWSLVRTVIYATRCSFKSVISPPTHEYIGCTGTVLAIVGSQPVFAPWYTALLIIESLECDLYRTMNDIGYWFFFSFLLQSYHHFLQLLRHQLLQQPQRVKFTNYLDKNQQLFFCAQRYCVHAT